MDSADGPTGLFMSVDGSSSRPLILEQPSPLVANNTDHSLTAVYQNLLIISPYTSLSHLLDLSTLDKPSQLLAKSLSLMTAIRADYATEPYLRVFNWPTMIDVLRALSGAEIGFHWQMQSFYVVVFRSRILPATDRSRLASLDKESHAEAVASGGLLKYWFGEPDNRGRNLATCIWREKKDAMRGSVGKGHRQAAKETRELYTEWKIERLKLVIDDGIQTWDLSEWKD